MLPRTSYKRIATIVGCSCGPSDVCRWVAMHSATFIGNFIISPLCWEVILACLFQYGKRPKLLMYQYVSRILLRNISLIAYSFGSIFCLKYLKKNSFLLALNNFFLCLFSTKIKLYRYCIKTSKHLHTTATTRHIVEMIYLVFLILTKLTCNW